jgi:cytochrome c oxidase subunit 2
LRRGAIVSLIAIAVVVAAITTAIAYFIDWLPEQASEERVGIDFVLWLTIAICIFVFAVVAAISIYAGFKFRVRPDDDSDGPPIHGHTGIEIVWTAVPTILVTIIAIASAVVLARNDRVSGDNPLTVEVTAQQFAWSFRYPEDGDVTSPNLYLPVDRSAKLVLQARDVIHSFWVPEFGQKQDAVPGIVTTLIVTPTKTGEYRIICTELCGLGHGLMRSKAVVVSEGEFATWLRQEGQDGEGGEGAGDDGEEGEGEAPDAEQLFVANCGSCHSFTEAGTSGTIGPGLDGLDTDPADAERQIRQGGGGMPPFEGRLSDAEIESLVQYLTGSRG